jgi:hypothetical protein
MRVSVGDVEVAVGGIDVAVDCVGVAVGGICVAVGCTGVADGSNVSVEVGHIDFGVGVLVESEAPVLVAVGCAVNGAAGGCAVGITKTSTAANIAITAPTLANMANVSVRSNLFWTARNNTTATNMRAILAMIPMKLQSLFLRLSRNTCQSRKRRQVGNGDEGIWPVHIA